MTDQNQTKGAIRANTNAALDPHLWDRAARDVHGDWAAKSEIDTDWVTADPDFNGCPVVVKLETRKRGGVILARASLYAKRVHNGYTIWGWSTGGFPAFKATKEGRATERNLNALHIQTLCLPAFKDWFEAACNHIATGGAL